MLDSTGTAPKISPAHRSVPAPKPPNLLVAWPSPLQVFWDNLLDTILRKKPLQPWLTSRPAEFWPDVFVDQRLPWRRLAGSGLYHAVFVALIYAITANMPSPAQIQQRGPFDGTKLTYYSVSEYLPEVDTGNRPESKEHKGEPAFAKQKIISIPPAPDNFRQTIITPDQIKITQDVPLPNIVANTIIPAPPEAAMTRSRITAPQFTPTVVAPPPDLNSALSHMNPIPSLEVIGPAADPTSARAKLNMPHVPGPEVVGPPPSLDAAHSTARLNVPEVGVVQPSVGGDIHRSVGEMNMARVNIGVDAPKLPIVEQTAGMNIRTASGSGGRRSSVGGVQVQAPSVASVAGGTPGAKDAGQFIALGIHPTAVNGPIVVPRGSRSGEFAAGPEGKPDAPGTPDIHARGNAASSGSGHGGSTVPLGISVAPGPAEVPPGPVVAAAPASPVARPPAKLLPSIRSTSVADLARNTRPLASPSAPAKPDEVFGTKKYYSMTLNMPSVTSASGSCVIRFAELNEQKAAGELTAPIATLKVDPAYPPEAIRDRVEGTVTLYAVIRKDGTVGGVRVLKGVDERLDRNAQVALSRWHFQPATRNGSAVDLEAVVQIPFVAKRAMNP